MQLASRLTCLNWITANWHARSRWTCPYNLLKLANSAIFARRSRIATVDSLGALGEREIRKWVTRLHCRYVVPMDGPISLS